MQKIVKNKKVKKKRTILNKPEIRFENSLLWVKEGIDFETRTVSITSDIDEKNMGEAVRAILKMAEMDLKSPIHVHISSFGGSVYDAFKLYDVMSCVPCPIYTYAFGKVMSAAFVLFLAGDVRYSLPRTTFMMHTISSGVEGKLFEQEIDIKEGRRLFIEVLKILENKTKKDVEWWRKQIKTHNIYFDINKAIELGVVTDKFDEPKR